MQIRVGSERLGPEVMTNQPDRYDRKLVELFGPSYADDPLLGESLLFRPVLCHRGRGGTDHFAANTDHITDHTPLRGERIS
jgi:hypothetical protein